MGALIGTGGAFLKGGLIGRRALNRIITVITVLEAILTGKQPRENIQCCVQFFFPSCLLKFPRKNCGQMSGKSKTSDRTNLGKGAAPINC